MNNTISFIDCNTIELHYWLTDGSHLMDANIFNTCEHEFLCIIKELSSALQFDIEVYVEPLGEGGIKSWLTLNGNPIKVSIVTALCTTLPFTPITTTIDYATRMALERFFEDPEIREKQKEKRKAELKLEIAKINNKLDSINEHKIKKGRSNYFKAASKCDNLEKISVSITNDSKDIFLPCKEIPYADFPKYIMPSDETKIERDDDATIEIISPVLKESKYSWRGIYQNQAITFKITSQEFKILVQQGDIRFKNGTIIQCLLEKKQKLNDKGVFETKGYEVTAVYRCVDNDVPIETPTGQRRRKQKEEEEQQQRLFDI